MRWSKSKVPLQVGGGAASSTDPRTWVGWGEACRSRVGVGVGFVLDGDGIVCLDLDHCLDEDGLAPWAADVLEEAGPTYVEVSPSGDGLHVWGWGHVPVGTRAPWGAGQVEAYGHGRYITVTGRRFDGAPPRLGDLTGVLEQLGV